LWGAVFLLGPCGGYIRRIGLICRQKAEIKQNHENGNVRNIGQGEPRHRKYKRLKLGSGQAYDRSSDKTAVVAGAGAGAGHDLLY
jgi:hypothetical protein